jgi:hypothetical protein
MILMADFTLGRRILFLVTTETWIHGNSECLDLKDGPSSCSRLRLRSPFSLTVIIMIGARVRDGGGMSSRYWAAL